MRNAWRHHRRLALIRCTHGLTRQRVADHVGKLRAASHRWNEAVSPGRTSSPAHGWPQPRFHLHFTPTSSSWLNLVERWFRELTDKVLRRGSLNSVPGLISKIETYLGAHNDDPKPFVWTATAKSILAKVRRGRASPSKPSAVNETHH